jgi:hypothetical protein
MFNFHHTIADTLSDVVIASVYMLASFVVHWVLTQLLSRSTVNEKPELFISV